MEVWFLEIIKAIGRLFLHPLLYFSILLVIVAGILRVKRERKDFHVRVQDTLHELKHLFPLGIIAGIILSIVAVGVGFTMPLPFIIMIGAITILFSLIGNARLLSPALTIGVALLIASASKLFEFNVPLIDDISSLHQHYFIGLALFLAILTLTEGFFMLKNGQVDISPKLRKSRRGLTVGAHQAKRFWFLPIFFFIPTGPISPSLDWWPVIEWGTQSYSLILVPFLLGFQHQIQSTLPQRAIHRLSKHVLLLGVVLTIVAASGFFFPTIIPLVVAVIAIMGRLWIAYQHRVEENATLYYFTPQNKGIMVLDVIPGSPAHKMGLKTGEIIESCNGRKVNNKQDLYMALLVNRAYCKLEVFDVNGEIRFLQRALYESDHHELGILFIEERAKRETVDAG